LSSDLKSATRRLVRHDGLKVALQAQGQGGVRAILHPALIDVFQVKVVDADQQGPQAKPGELRERLDGLRLRGRPESVRGDREGIIARFLDVRADLGRSPAHERLAADKTEGVGHRQDLAGIDDGFWARAIVITGLPGRNDRIGRQLATCQESIIPTICRWAPALRRSFRALVVRSKRLLFTEQARFTCVPHHRIFAPPSGITSSVLTVSIAAPWPALGSWRPRERIPFFTLELAGGERIPFGIRPTRTGAMPFSTSAC
jgi:hypothetical protein